MTFRSRISFNLYENGQRASTRGAMLARPGQSAILADIASARRRGVRSPQTFPTNSVPTACRRGRQTLAARCHRKASTEIPVPLCS